MSAQQSQSSPQNTLLGYLERIGVQPAPEIAEIVSLAAAVHEHRRKKMASDDPLVSTTSLLYAVAVYKKLFPNPISLIQQKLAQAGLDWLKFMKSIGLDDFKIERFQEPHDIDVNDSVLAGLELYKKEFSNRPLDAFGFAYCTIAVQEGWLGTYLSGSGANVDLAIDNLRSLLETKQVSVKPEFLEALRERTLVLFTLSDAVASSLMRQEVISLPALSELHSGDCVAIYVIDGSPPAVKYLLFDSQKSSEGQINFETKFFLSRPITEDMLMKEEKLKEWEFLTTEARFFKHTTVIANKEFSSIIWSLILTNNSELAENFIESGEVPKDTIQEAPSTEPAVEKRPPPTTKLHSDKWTLEDKLGYELYARAIAEFIRHPDTNAPLTIGIIGPWGQGKTTLMKLIERHLKPENENKDKPKSKNKRKQEAKDKWPAVTTFSALWDKLCAASNPFLPTKLKYPTVWFNAWKYQTSEQLWAGMAQSIIEQLVKQIPTQAEREQFWLGLQYDRLDLDALRKDIHRTVLENFIPKILRWLFVAAFGLLLSFAGIVLYMILGANIFDSFGKWLLASGTATSIFTLIPIIRKWFESRSQVMEKPLEGAFVKYVRQPDYESKMGYFSQVERDVRKVFDLIVDPNEPGVVFVDDLDRCSPGKVAEAIEAINLFLSGDFPNCYFVVGLDAQVVAASMEAAYKDLTEKLTGMTRSYGSLGWYFMDKFIQLPFILPSMSEPQRDSFLLGLFPQKQGSQEAGDPDVELRKIEERIENLQKHPPKNAAEATAAFREIGQQSSLLRETNPTKANELLQGAIVVGAKVFSDEDPEIQSHLSEYSRYLGNSPRTLKRFANLYRFYRLSQWSRELQGQKIASSSALARWLVIMLVWPQLVRWIQWEAEAQSFGGASPAERAEKWEGALQASKSFQDWVNGLAEAKIDKAAWCTDQRLFDFIRTRKSDDDKISAALEFGVW